MNLDGWELVGVCLQTFGLAVTGRGLWLDHRQYGEDQPFVPALAKAADWLRQKLGRAPAITVTPDVVGTGSLVAAPAVLESQLPDDAPIDEVMRVFEARLAFLRAGMDEVRQEMNERDSAIRQLVDKVQSEARQGDAALRTRLSRMATDRVRVEMFGLIVAGVGSIVGVLG